MTTVIDYAWSQPSPQWIKQQGFAGVMRYISHDGSKDLSPQERDALRAESLTIGLVFEATANRAAQGFAAGIQDAQYAEARCNSLGYPLVCTVWYAVDFDGTPGQVQSYFDGIMNESLRPIAPYGGYKIADGVKCSGSPWQTAAWSGGKISGRAGLYQNGFHATYDSNKVLKENYGQWGFNPPTPVVVSSRGRFVQPGNEGDS